MKRFRESITFLTLAFVSIFILNMLVMRVFFDTDVFNPVRGREMKIDLATPQLIEGYAAAEDARQMEARHADARNIDAWNTDAGQAGVEQAGAEQTGAADESPVFVAGASTAAGAESSAAGEGEDPDTTYFMTTGEVGFLENLNIVDKLDALSLISRVGREEADRIYDMAVDGVTYTEIESIKSILRRYLTEEEMDKLNSLLEKNKRQYSDARD